MLRRTCRSLAASTAAASSVLFLRLGAAQRGLNLTGATEWNGHTATSSISVSAVRRTANNTNTAAPISATIRDDISRTVSGIRDEAKGQALDLGDMSDSARSAHQLLTTCAKTHAAVDPSVVSRLNSLSVGMKAYATRLSHLQTEAKKLNADAEALVKILWGTEKATSVPVPDFEVDPPPMAKKLEELNAANSNGGAAPVERVEGEHLRGDAAAPAAADPSAAPGEIEVEAVEIDTPKAAPATSEPDDIDEMSVTQLTQALHEKNVDFSDCRDGRTLRQRYRDFLAGKVGAKARQPPTPPRSSASTPARPPPPQQQQQAPPNTTESGLAVDPYPGAHRKMIDPMKYVHEVKAELAVEHRVDARTIDLWSGQTKLDDHRRLYEYPGLQHYPIEVRNKGDAPKAK